jgi:hypothetical protein
VGPDGLASIEDLFRNLGVNPSVPAFDCSAQRRFECFQLALDEEIENAHQQADLASYRE